MIYVDSNYWIYWLDSRLAEHEHVIGVMNQAIREEIVLNNITLVEVGHYLRRLELRQFHEFMERVQGLPTVTIAALDDSVTQLAIELMPRLARNGLGGRDCVVIATMRIHGVRRIATHDHSFTNLQDLEVVDSIP